MEVAAGFSYFYGKNDMGCFIIVLLVCVGAALFANSRIIKWQQRAATAYFIIAKKATSAKEREWGYRNAYMCGHPKAKFFYIYAAADAFSGRQPLVPFVIHLEDGEDVTAIFYDYYIRDRHISYGSERQQEVTQRVLELKDGENPSSDLYSEALRTLEAHFKEDWRRRDGPVVIFMPCSGEQAHLRRFDSLSRSLKWRYKYNTDIEAVQYTGVRRSKHRSRNRSAIEANSNIVISPTIIGKEVIIIDDVITTGSSLREFACELRTYGVKIKAAVFLAQTAKLPTDKEIHRHIKSAD